MIMELSRYAGGGYVASYKHFRAQHMDGTNLFLHVLCMAWQLSANYALLGTVDDAMTPESCTEPCRKRRWKVLSLLTSALWSLQLLRTQPTPMVVKAASVACILFAQQAAADFFDRHWRNLVFYQGFLEAAAFQGLVLKKPRLLGAPSVGYFMVRTLLWKVLSDREGVWSEYSKQIGTVLLALVMSAASSKNPLQGTVGPLGFFGWIFALLTGEKSIYFWSCGMTASIAQGVAHHAAGEAGTLEVLSGDALDQTRYELSHVTYFPNLVWQAVHAHLRA
eukprot:TRINITY_DN31272_c0_g1_i3.p1 TRINITY_DN31272_c0_g1~~TRINITY_DN31272_c0_g1_i3.p1  ORF type:complete len:278 (-),score=34.42 TRINITY_DN31272_c0_g1_i3:132-965(-)